MVLRGVVGGNALSGGGVRVRDRAGHVGGALVGSWPASWTWGAQGSRGRGAGSRRRSDDGHRSGDDRGARGTAGARLAGCRRLPGHRPTTGGGEETNDRLRGDGGLIHGVLLSRGMPPRKATALQTIPGNSPKATPARLIPCHRARIHPHADSRTSSARLMGSPHAKPPRLPSERSTRWHGTKSAGALRAQIDAAARTAAGWPIAAAKAV